MAASAEDKNKENFSENFDWLKPILLARVCDEIHAKLRLCQQSIYRNTFKTAKGNISLQNSNLIENKNSMPPSEILDAIKMDKELDTLKNIFITAYEIFNKENLDDEKSYIKLSNMIETQKDIDSQVDILKKELNENKVIVKDLEYQLKNKHDELTKSISEKSQRVEDLHDELNKMQRIHRIEFKLVQEWEMNRLAQVNILAEKKERLLIQTIEELHRRIADEHRFIREVNSFRNNEATDLSNQISYWKQKFEQDKTEVEAKNFILSQKIADVVRTYAKCREVSEQRKLFIAEYLRQKAEEQRLYEEQQYRINCAIRIQAWWRGIMVRRGLGPYRKKSKRSKKSKNKNKINN